MRSMEKRFDPNKNQQSPRQPGFDWTPTETPEQRAARIRASRLRRLETVQARIAAYEAAHPDTTLGPSVASNNWRHRLARVNTEIDAAVQYEKDQKTARHLTWLLAKEN